MNGLKVLLVLSGTITVIGIKLIIDKHDIKKRQQRIEVSLEKVKELSKDLQKETFKLVASPSSVKRTANEKVVIVDKIANRLFKSADIVSLALAKAQKESKHA